MKKEILYEINRYKEIMGLSLLSEGPGGPGISLLGIGKAMTVFAGLSDDIAKYLNDSKLLMALDDSSPLLTKYPILGDIRNTIQNEIGARDLVDNDIQYLKHIDDTILNYFENSTTELRGAFIEEYIDNVNGLAQVKNNRAIEDQFKAAAKLGIKELTGLKSELTTTIQNSIDIPVYMKDYLINKLETSAEKWEDVNLKDRKYKTAINKSYDEFMNEVANKNGVNVDSLKKAVPSASVDKFKKKLIQNNGDINLTVSQLRSSFNKMVQKIADREGKTTTEVITESLGKASDVVKSVLNVYPFNMVWKNFDKGNMWKGTKQLTAIVAILALGGVVSSYWKEIFEGFGINELTDEETTLKNKFPSLSQKTNMFWKTVYGKILATGKVSEIMRAEATATEEKITDNVTSEDRFKVTFNWADDLGSMVFFTDNEGEEVSYNYGSGVFPIDKFAVPENTEKETPEVKNKATDSEFKEWWKNYAETEVETVTIDGNQVTVKVKNGGTFLYKKVSENNFEYVSTL